MPTPPVAPPPADLPHPADHDPELTQGLRTVMPWALSFILHAGVVLLAVALVVGAREIIRDNNKHVHPQMEASGNPDDLVDIDAPAPPVGMVNGDPDLAQLPTGIEIEVTPVTMPLPPGGILPTQSRSLPTPGANNSVSAGMPKGTSMFGIPGGTGKPGDHGLRGPQRIAYLIDASGSLCDTLPFVKEELMKVVNRMQPGKAPHQRSFNVIFFSGRDTNLALGLGEPGLASVFDRLQVADEEHRRQAILQIQAASAGGTGNPLAAIRRALDQGATEIHLLSDNITGRGQWELSQERFVAEVKKAVDDTAGRRALLADGKTRQDVRFVCYQFVYEDPMTLIDKPATLQRLVSATGGDPAHDYVFVSARSLGLR